MGGGALQIEKNADYIGGEGLPCGKGGGEKTSLEEVRCRKSKK